MPKRDIPEKWLQPPINHLTSRFEIPSQALDCQCQESSHKTPSSKGEKVRQPYVSANDGFQLVSSSSDLDTGFYNWLINQRKSKRTVRHYVSYAQRFGSVLDTGDANAIITRLKPSSHHHALSALANLAKYTGRYDQFNQIRRNYNLRWTKADSTRYFQRFFDEELTLDVMIQRIREMIRLLPPPMGKIIKFGVLVGLRASEVIESVRLLQLNQKNSYYYKPERQALEHFRFPEIFLRQTKKAYISFVTESVIEDIQMQHNVATTRNAITLACQRRHIKMEMYLTRKIFASYLRKEGIQPEVVDLLQGRVAPSVLTRHYLVPNPSFKEDVLQALNGLKKEIEVS